MSMRTFLSFPFLEPWWTERNLEKRYSSGTLPVLGSTGISYLLPSFVATHTVAIFFPEAEPLPRVST